MRNNETGRSMVEMLGVLAIIGVLSVAGIAGYSMAMRKIRVNDAASAAAQCGILARTFQGGSVAVAAGTACTTVGVEADSYSTTTFPTMTVQHAADSDTVTVTITANNADNCTALQQVLGSGACNAQFQTAYSPNFD